MKFKIDESLHSDCAKLLREGGHDALSVYDQKLSGSADTKIAEVCKEEQRILISADLDFSDVRHFPPAEYPGFIVIREKNQSKYKQLESIEKIIPILDKKAIQGFLWIVKGDKIRIRPHK